MSAVAMVNGQDMRALAHLVRVHRDPFGRRLKVCAIVAALPMFACASMGDHAEDPTEPRNAFTDGGDSPASCGDLTPNRSETDIENRDCADGTCTDGGCSSCDDRVKNGDESDVDCGGACSPCAIEQSCSTELDCATGACFGNICLPTPCGNALGLETTQAGAMWGICPTRLRTTMATISLTAPDGANWTFSTGDGVDSSPAVGIDGTTYVGSRDKNLYAIDPLGHERWRLPTGGHVSSSPAIRADGAVVFGSDDGKMYALGPDGSLLWSVVTGGAVESSPLIGPDATVYVGSNDGVLRAISRIGSVLWQTTIAGLGGVGVRSSPALSHDGKTLYVGSESNDLWALGTSDGSVKWTFATENHVRSSPAVAVDGTIVFGSDDHRVYAIRDRGTQAEERWRFTTDGPVRSSPAVIPHGPVIVGSSDGKLYGLSPDDGLDKSERTLFEITTSSAIESAPLVTNDGHVLFTANDGKLRLADVDGHVKWSFDLGSASRSSPVLTRSGTVIVGTDAGTVQSVGVEPLGAPQIAVSGPLTRDTPVTIGLAVDVRELPDVEPECRLDVECSYTMTFDLRITHLGTLRPVADLSQTGPVTSVGSVKSDFLWSGLRDDLQEMVPDGLYRIDASASLQRVIGPEPRTPLMMARTSTMGLGGQTPGAVLLDVCSSGGCASTAPRVLETEPVCELIANTDMGFPTDDRRVCDPEDGSGCNRAVRFLFGDVPPFIGAKIDPDFFSVRLNGESRELYTFSDVFLTEAGPAVGNDDPFATWTAPRAPAKGLTCGAPLVFPTAPDGSKRAQPQTFDGPWQEGLKNDLGSLLLIGPAFSVRTPHGGQMFAMHSESEADNLAPGAPMASLPAFPCTTDADCQTPNTPNDTCTPFFEPWGGVCRLGGSCEGADADLCFVRRAGLTLSVSTSEEAPQDFLRLATDDAHPEVLLALSGTERMGKDGIEYRLGGPFNFPMFLVEDYEGRSGVWVYGHASIAGAADGASSAVHLMRIDVDPITGKLEAPHYVAGCTDSSGAPASCSASGVKPNLVLRNVSDPNAPIPSEPIFSEDQTIIFNNGTVSRVPGIGPEGSAAYVMAYGGSVAPTFMYAALFEPVVTAELVADALSSGVHIRTAPTPWGPWSPSELAYSPWRTGNEGVCELFRLSDGGGDDTRQVSAALGIGPALPFTNEDAYCRFRAAVAGKSPDAVAAQNAELANMGPMNLDDHGAPYGIAVIDALTEPISSSDPRAPGVWVYWMMSTWVPYRVLLMRTAIAESSGTFARQLPSVDRLLARQAEFRVTSNYENRLPSPEQDCAFECCLTTACCPEGGLCP